MTWCFPGTITPEIKGEEGDEGDDDDSPSLESKFAASPPPPASESHKYSDDVDKGSLSHVFRGPGTHDFS